MVIIVAAVVCITIPAGRVKTSLNSNKRLIICPQNHPVLRTFSVVEYQRTGSFLVVFIEFKIAHT